jgi:hypothetical protein
MAIGRQASRAGGHENQSDHMDINSTGMSMLERRDVQLSCKGMGMTDTPNSSDFS